MFQLIFILIYGAAMAICALCVSCSGSKALGSITRTHLSDIMEPTAVFEDIGQDFVDILMVSAAHVVSLRNQLFP